MRDFDLFQLALGLVPPWMVAHANFDAAKKRLDIEIDFKVGGGFACPECGKADCPVHDTVKKTWRHLNFFQHQAFLHARVARIDCPNCGMRLVNVPWARRLLNGIEERADPHPHPGWPAAAEAL